MAAAYRRSGVFRAVIGVQPDVEPLVGDVILIAGPTGAGIAAIFAEEFA